MLTYPMSARTPLTNPDAALMLLIILTSMREAPGFIGVGCLGAHSDTGGLCQLTIRLSNSTGVGEPKSVHGRLAVARQATKLTCTL